MSNNPVRSSTTAPSYSQRFVEVILRGTPHHDVAVQLQKAGYDRVTDVVALNSKPMQRQDVMDNFLGINAKQWFDMYDALTPSVVEKHLFLDNSNFRIGAKAIVGRLRRIIAKPKPRTVEHPDFTLSYHDNRVWMDAGELIRVALESTRTRVCPGEQVSLGYACVAGSMPPTTDSVWEKFLTGQTGKDDTWKEVWVTTRSPHDGRENQVDQSLIAMMWKAAHEAGPGRHVFTLMSGDIGYMAAAKSILSTFPTIKLEIWAWHKTMNKEYTQLVTEYKDRVMLFTLDVEGDFDHYEIPVGVNEGWQEYTPVLPPNPKLIRTIFGRKEWRAKKIKPWTALVLQQVSTAKNGMVVLSTTNAFSSLSISSQQPPQLWAQFSSPSMLFSTLARIPVAAECIPTKDGRVILWFRMLQVLHEDRSRYQQIFPQFMTWLDEACEKLLKKENKEARDDLRKKRTDQLEKASCILLLQKIVELQVNRQCDKMSEKQRQALRVSVTVFDPTGERLRQQGVPILSMPDKEVSDDVLPSDDEQNEESGVLNKSEIKKESGASYIIFRKTAEGTIERVDSAGQQHKGSALVEPEEKKDEIPPTVNTGLSSNEGQPVNERESAAGVDASAC